MDGSEEPTKGMRENGLRPKTYHGTQDGAIGHFRGQTGTGPDNAAENPTMPEEVAKTVFINSTQENGTICLVISISPSSARSNTGHRRKKPKKQTTLHKIETTYETNNIYERTSLTISQPPQRTTLQHCHIKYCGHREETTVNKQH